jgi:hypothetical protein
MVVSTDYYNYTHTHYVVQRGRGAPAERSGDRVPPSGWKLIYFRG